MNNRRFMLQAIKLASKARGMTSPNPMVGCVIVKDKKIIATGYHFYAGSDHAEIVALKKAGSLAMGATMYVNLEPCCHYGLTPPCVNRIIEAKIKRIFIAIKDPNPMVNGQAIDQLQQAGIEVEMGLCAIEATELNKIFIHYIKTKLPYVIVKWAMSVDGKIAAFNQKSKWISGEKSRTHCHELRKNCDAILVGSETALIDNPSLTARKSLKQPIRIILDRNGKLPLNLNIFTDQYAANTILVTSKLCTKERLEILEQRNIEILIIEQTANQQISLPHLLKELGKRKITNLLVEGGAKIHTSFFNEKLVNEAKIYIAPKIIGGIKALSPILGQGKSSIPTESEFIFKNIERLGEDLLLTINFNDKSEEKCFQVS